MDRGLLSVDIAGGDGQASLQDTLDDQNLQEHDLETFSWVTASKAAFP